MIGAAFTALRTAGPWLMKNFGASKLLKTGAITLAANETSELATDKSLLGHGIDKYGEIVEDIAEKGAQAGENAKAHGRGQNLISWSNIVSNIPVLGESSFGQMIAKFLRNWGEKIQNANTENDGSKSTSNPGIESEESVPSLFNDAAKGVGIGATLGFVIPGVGNAVGAFSGAVIGGAGGVIKNELRDDNSFISSTFKKVTSMFSSGNDEVAPPTPSPSGPTGP